MHRFRRPALAIPAIMLGICALTVAADWLIALPEDVHSTYVGHQKCIECHEPEYHKWHGSDHDKAMEPATAETVLGNFDDQTFTYNGVSSRLFRESDKFFVTTDNAQGELETFEVKYTFGVRPLQQYLVEMAGGHVQVLPFCWDTKRERWFHIYQHEEQPVVPGERIHWTGPAQNWNYMCAECHSTNLRKNYDLAAHTYDTQFSEIDVSCESCHGPGSTHIELAKSKSLFWDRRHGYGLARLKGKDPTAEIETCARCHSRRRIVQAGYHAGQPFMDHYAVELLEDGLYHADGQIDEEVYVYGSFLQSLMYRKGVRCTDCHDPHTAGLRAVGNQLCTRCHTPAKYDSPGHHHHLPDSSGAQCVECHMPEKTYMVVDPRRDHSIRIPRPDLSLALGTPNACTKCHFEREQKKTDDDRWRDYAHCLEAAHSEEPDEEAEQLLRRLDAEYAAKTLEWFPEQDSKRHNPHFGRTLAAARRGRLNPHQEEGASPHADDGEIAQRLTRLARGREGPIVRATAVSLLPAYPTATAREANDRALKDREPLVRLAAVRNLEAFHAFQPDEAWAIRQSPERVSPAIAQRLQDLSDKVQPLLSDNSRAVRSEAARIASIIPRRKMPGPMETAFDQAMEEFLAGQHELADQPGAHVTLGAVYSNLGELKKAEASYRRAIAMQEDFVPARINLALLYDLQNRKDEAEKLLREAIQRMPDLSEADEYRGVAHYYLGLLLAEQQDQLAQAAEELAAAVKYQPQAPRYRYNYAVALHQLEKWNEAEQAYLAALQLEPGSAEYRNGLTALYSQQAVAAAQRGDLETARKLAESALKLAPDNPHMQRLLQQLKALGDRPPSFGPQLPM